MQKTTRYTISEIQRNEYFQLPKFLFNRYFKELNNDARVLYSLLKDRHRLSVKNKWVNDAGEVYLVFSRAEMCETLHLSKPTVIRAMNSLKQHGLIEEQRLGQGKKNRIFLMAINPLHDWANEDFEKDSVFTSESKSELPSEVISDSHISKSNISKSELSNQSQSHDGSSAAIDHDGDSDPADPESDDSLEISGSTSTINDYNAYKTLLHKNIDYERITKRNHHFSLHLDELVECMLDVICTDEPTVTINGERKNRQLVISQYLKLDYDNIMHVLTQFDSQQHKIKHVHNYLKTMLYTVRQEGFHQRSNVFNRSE